jgi:cell division protein FtsL
MALRIALPHPAENIENPVEAVRARRLSLRTYLELDPAIRFVIALGLVAAISLLYLVQTSSVTELNYQVQRMEVERTRLLRDRQQLQLDIAHAQALTRIQQVAVDRLHMVPVGDQHTFVAVPPPNPEADGLVPVPPMGGGAAPPPPGDAPPGGGASP